MTSNEAEQVRRKLRAKQFEMRTFLGASISASIFIVGSIFVGYRLHSANLSDSQIGIFWMMVSLGLGLISLFISQFLAVDKTMKALSDNLLKSHDLRHLGDANNAINYFVKKLPRAISVKNTGIRYIPQNAEVGTAFGKSIHKLDEVILKGIKDGRLSWKDLFGKNSAYRFKLVEEYEIEHRTQQYVRYRVDNNFAAINFIILIYEEPLEREVLFGWGFGVGAEGGMPVFQSSDEEVIRLFEEYWATLVLIAGEPEEIGDEKKP